MRYLAIDYGSKRTGMAICDAEERLASPYAVIENPKIVLDKISETVKKEQIEAIVVGLPLNMDDSEGPQAKLVLKFGEQLKTVVDIPVQFHDDRLSSFSAEQKLLSGDYTRKKKKKRLDAVAAAEILQAFLEYKKTGNI